MPRFVVERDFGKIGEEEMQEVAARLGTTLREHFPGIRWERSHVCTAGDGAIKSFCVYSAPSSEQLQDHADRVGGHDVHRIYEIVGDVTPEEVTV